MKFIETWKGLNAFQAQYRPISALIWLSALTVSAIFVFPSRWADMPFLAVAVITIAYPTFSALSRYEVALAKRIDAGDKAPTWQVSVNGVTVGIISDAAYATVRRSVFFDVRTCAAQLLNFCNVLSRIVDLFFMAIPLGAFWSGLVCLFFAPDIFAELQKVTLAQIASSVPMILQVYILIVFVLAAMGKRFGFVNRFDQAINERVRRAVGCAAEGDVLLSSFDQA